MKRILLSWSSGKDSAWALHALRQSSDYEVAGLLTTFNQAANRVAMHAVRRELVEAQAEAAGVPLWPVELPWPCSNREYEAVMRAACVRAVAEGIEGVAFGDLFLEDVRARPILYVPLSKGGDPARMAQARMLQQTLRDLVTWCRERHASVIMIDHTNKNKAPSGGKPKPGLDRVYGAGEKTSA